MAPSAWLPGLGLACKTLRPPIIGVSGFSASLARRARRILRALPMTGNQLLDLRRRSLVVAEQLGYEINPQLPHLDSSLRGSRTSEQIATRALCLCCAVAVANGAAALAALEWASSQSLLTEFSPLEREFLNSPRNSFRAKFLGQEEALWALAWAGGLHEKLAFDTYCDSRLAKMFPNFVRAEAIDPFLTTIAVRNDLEVLGALDLAYCLHWAIVQDEILGREVSHPVDSYVIVERRRALEWLMSEQNWDEINLDT